MGFDAIIIGWIIVNALIGGAIGQSKNRIGGGIVLSLLLGPLGWLLVAAGPNMGPKCPDCGGVVVEGARKCKNCGSDLNSSL